MDIDRKRNQEMLNFEFVKVFRRNRRLVSLFTFLSGLLFAVISFLQPPVFKATAVVLPPISEKFKLTSIARSLSRGAAETTPALAALAILKSRQVKEDIVKKFNLIDVYEAKNLDNAIRILGRNTSIRFLNNEGTIKISVYDRDPHRAADLANYYIQSAEKLNEDLQVFVKRPMLKIVDPAVSPSEKAKPHRVLDTVVGLIVGFVFGIIVIFFRNIREEKLYTLSNVSSCLGTSALVVPKIREIRESKDLYKKLYIPEDEAFGFWTKLKVKHCQKGPIFLGVTSPRRREGKTFVSIQLALLLKKNNGKCLLVEMNPLFPAIRNIFSLSEENCLDITLTGKDIESVALKPQDFPCHIASFKAFEKLSDPAVLKRFREACSNYEFVIFDLPHIFSEVPIWEFFKGLDSIFITYRFSQTSVRDIMKVCNILADVKLGDVEFILNGFDERIHSL